MDHSPWLHNDLSEAHPGVLNGEIVVELGAIDKAIMLAIGDLANQSSDDLSDKASFLLVDISVHYPILIVRHLPHLIRAMALYIHRHSRRLSGEPLMSQGFGSGSVKVTFSIAPPKLVMASKLHAAWVKSMRSLHTKGLNESIDAIVRKICAREGLSF